MHATMRLAALVCLAGGTALAGTWSGYLVDSKCFEISEQNTNPNDTLTFVDRDRDLEARLCTPSAKTKSFVLMEQYGLSFKLDAAGNARAAELVRKTGKKSLFAVTVTGEAIKNTVKVDSISIAR